MSLAAFCGEFHFEWISACTICSRAGFETYFGANSQDDTYTESYISTIGVDFVSIPHSAHVS